MKQLHKILLVAYLIFITGCSDTLKANNPHLVRLKNRGPVPLSADNPYLAANALLLKEMENSDELRGFLKQRSQPAAIEVNKSLFDPLQISLYYPEKAEAYNLEAADDTWIITGPYRITKAKLQQLRPISMYSRSQVVTANTNGPKTSPVNSHAGSQPSYNKAAVNSPKTLRAPALRQEDSSMRASYQGNRPMDMLARKYAKYPAEITPKGDLVHYVVSPDENLGVLARWYTFDINNQVPLARINNLKSDQELSVGDTIVIPRYLLKNSSRLTESALVELNSKISNGSIE